MGLSFSRKIASALALPLFLLTASFSPHSQLTGHKLCKGFVEENDWQIPVTTFSNSGVTESQFHSRHRLSRLILSIARKKCALGAVEDVVGTGGLVNSGEISFIL